MFFSASLSEIPWEETMENRWLWWTWYENLFFLFCFCCSSSFFVRQRSNFFKTLEPSVLAELPRLATFIEDRSMNWVKTSALQHSMIGYKIRQETAEMNVISLNGSVSRCVMNTLHHTTNSPCAGTEGRCSFPTRRPSLQLLVDCQGGGTMCWFCQFPLISLSISNNN